MPPVKYGCEHEEDAIRQYETECSQSVVKCGVFLHSSGLLGGSPDGLLDSDGIVEIKCPYQLRDCQETNAFDRLGYLKKGKDLSYELVRTHKYFHQIQGNLFFTNRDFCDLVVWSPHFMIRVRVDKDPSWGDNITLLQNYYIETVYPKIREFYTNENVM